MSNNPKIEEFLNKGRDAAKLQAKAERDRVLKEAGLFETEITYRDTLTYECQNYDKEKKKYYGETTKVLEVTDEEFAEISKYVGALKTELPLDNGAEVTLNIIATIFLILGIIATVICIVLWAIGLWEGFSLIGLTTTIAILFGSLTIWATLKVFSTISLTLKQINSKLSK